MSHTIIPGASHSCLTKDCSELPLFASVDPAVESLSTFAAFTALFDNYKPSPSEVEEQTEEELAEEARFLEEVTATEVMRTTYQFLVDRGNNKHGLSHIDRVLTKTKNSIKILKELMNVAI